MASSRPNDRRVTVWVFTVLAVAFHKYTHEGWRVLLQSVGFETGLFGSSDWLGSYRTASERAINEWLALNFIQDDFHVLNRLIQNQMHGIFSAGISLGLEGSYQSQIGLAGWVVTLPATLIGLTGTAARFSIYTLAAVGNAAVAVIIIGHVRRAFGVGAAAVVLMTLLQPWILITASTPFLFLGLRILPAVWTARSLRRGDGTLRNIAIVPSIITVCALASGYGWVTAIVAIGVATVMYYAVLESWTLRRTLRMCAYSLIGSVGGLIVTLMLHVAQLSLRFGSFETGWRQIAYALTKRTGSGGETVTDPLLLEALASSPRLVLDWYLGMPIFLSPARVAIIGNFTVIMLLAVCVFIVLHDFIVEPSSPQLLHRQAAGVAWVVSLLGPIGWMLLFRPTVYIHTHIDGAVWYLPTIPLGLLIIWSKLSDAQRSLSVRTKVYLGTMIAVAVLIGALYLVSWSLVEPLP
jgi:hypothetical protein